MKTTNRTIDNKIISNKFATHFLLNTINDIKLKYGQDKIMLYCEPIMGDNSRSITYKNYMLSSDDRYQTLINYYKKLGLTNQIETNNTLHQHLYYDDVNIRRMRTSMYGLI
jgi:hypothetical protein